VKGGTQPPVDPPGSTADPCGFAVSVDREAAQIALRGRPTGAGGGASLRPAPGVELVFDRIDGWLSCVIVAAGEPGSAVAPGEGTIGFIASVFGARTAGAVREAPSGEVRRLALRAQSVTMGVLSRLARLNAARLTSPVPESPLWAAEAWDLAPQADLPGRAGVRRASVTIPNGLGSTIPAEILAQSPAVGGPGPFAGAATRHGGRQLNGWLDLGLVPDGVFRPGLWPGSDLGIRDNRDGAPLIVVEVAVLAASAPETLADCRARLVDASARRVLATAAFRVGTPMRAGRALQAYAELPAAPGLRAPAGLGTPAESDVACVEVVDDERRPVHGTRLRRMRRALRWADAALRAESRPNGLAPELSDEQWTRLAGLAWDRCRADWDAAGDPGRAALAAARGSALRGTLGGALRSGASVEGLPGGAAVRRARPFLAELVCDPAVTG